ncbi:MAG: DNA cytosine methyltransferase [Candidatus Thiodiazotropha weberae]|nr:DNA cytosine methyltransferase [Candidatus Thiodiazotropha weberae]
MKYLSLFSGIESATVAWEPMGWEPVAFCENEPFCCELLAHRYPQVPNLGDIKAVTRSMVASLGRFDLVVFGSPCQDLSVAGKREGLQGDRSGLFRRAVEVIGWCRELCGCWSALWENVPGVFSSHQGGDFSEVLRLFTGQRQGIPRKGWQTSGVAYGPEALVEWRVLDAQYFGVPQRRRRVFAFVDFGDGARTDPVLFEPEGVCGDFEAGGPSPEAVAGTLEGRTSAGGFPGTDGACANHVVVDTRQDPVTSDIALTVDSGIPCNNGVLSPELPCFWDGGQTSQCLDAVLAKGQCMPEKNRFPAVLEPVPIHDQATRHSGKRADHQDGKGNGLGVGNPGDPMNTLTQGDKHAVCFQPRVDASIQVTTESVVRRLTPTECERLQGIPDNFTRIPYRNKPADQCPDTPRYRAIGNAMAVPVMHWIGQRIEVSCGRASLRT